MKAAVASVLLLAAGGAEAGALAECRGATRTPAELMACLQSARRQAGDRMLESFLAIEQRLGRLEVAPGRERSLAALKQSQRDFERYLRAHCQVMQWLASGAAAGPAALGCDVDQLRARAAALDGLAVDQPN